VGVALIYQAVPPESGFYRRLQAEQPLALLVASVFGLGKGPFNLFEIPGDDHEEVIDFVMERYPDDLGRGEAARRRWVQQLHDEIERTRVMSPGIEGRVVWLDKCVDEIEHRLKDRFATLGASGPNWSMECSTASETSEHR
jgi:hypothetical protein